MKRHHSSYVLLCALILALAPASWADDLSTLREWMTGSFSSQEQAATDEDFFDIRLEMVEIWTERDDGPWLYVEQAAASRLDAPYRQRIYRLRSVDGAQFGSAVFEFPEPLDFAGAWSDPSRFDALSPDDLTLRTGCEILLSWDEDKGAFVGSTQERACLSQHRGATWASSEVQITQSGLLTWDRGFDDTGAQVWGATKAGYLFDRVK